MRLDKVQRKEAGKLDSCWWEPRGMANMRQRMRTERAHDLILLLRSTRWQRKPLLARWKVGKGKRPLFLQCVQPWDSNLLKPLSGSRQLCCRSYTLKALMYKVHLMFWSLHDTPSKHILLPSHYLPAPVLLLTCPWQQAGVKTEGDHWRWIIGELPKSEAKTSCLPSGGRLRYMSSTLTDTATN